MEKAARHLAGRPSGGRRDVTLASMLGVAGLAAVSLLWLLLKRGRVGGKSRVAVCWLLVLVLGFGGWFAGVFVALVWLPTVPLLDDLLVALSVGIPVGLGVVGAWSRREWPARTNWAGLFTGLGSALAGAWLGFHTMPGPLAVLTAVVGAAVGANLAVLGLDILRARSARDATAAPAPAAVVSAGAG